ncbi:DUF6507 family protein [Zhihengliuella salsuginis]|uniref:Uncharacterized protein n=1 Tax=Zhihengliuella salsuginis TaxID=578222 RepID=A0ABQ3GH08_9MICC|nr:DUF6507 family protein [Zhihengliuella salsuginis]GHD06124.1 hypothetical protein GCM10008096_15720 [Zhihengliuella salsuginis]
MPRASPARSGTHEAMTGGRRSLKFDIHHDAAQQTTRVAESNLAEIREHLAAVEARDRALRGGLSQSDAVRSALEELSNYVVAPTEQALRESVDAAIHWTRVALGEYAAGDQKMADNANRSAAQAASPHPPGAPG